MERGNFSYYVDHWSIVTVATLQRLREQHNETWWDPDEDSSSVQVQVQRDVSGDEMPFTVHPLS